MNLTIKKLPIQKYPESSSFHRCWSVKTPWKKGGTFFSALLCMQIWTKVSNERKQMMSKIILDFCFEKLHWIFSYNDCFNVSKTLKTCLEAFNSLYSLKDWDAKTENARFSQRRGERRYFPRWPLMAELKNTIKKSPTSLPVRLIHLQSCGRPSVSFTAHRLPLHAASMIDGPKCN